MDRLNQSLDDIITANKAKHHQQQHHKLNRNHKPGRGKIVHSSNKSFANKNKFHSQPTNFISKKPLRPLASKFNHPNPPVIVNKQQILSHHNSSTIASTAHSIFDRLGTTANPNTSNGNTSGTKITITNLNKNISINDITQLCGSIGEVKQVEMKHDQFGNPLGIAEVLFARRSDATTQHNTRAIKKFHGLTLDGTPMKVTLTGEGGKINPFNPIPIPTEPPNKRLGFFGTALQEGGEGVEEEEVIYVDEDGNQIDFIEEEVVVDEEEEDPYHSFQNEEKTTFAVTLRNNFPESGVGHGRGRGRGGGYDGRGRGGRRGGGRGRRGGGRGGGRGRSGGNTISLNDLDNEMESYMNKK